MFETADLIIHNVTLRADDIVEISYTEKRFMLDWGYKTELWSFDRNAIPDVELAQLIESAEALIDLVSVKARGE